MSDSPVGIFLKNTNVVQRIASLSQLLLLGAFLLLVTLLAAIAIDAALALPVWLRLLVDVAIVGVAAFLFVKAIRVLLASRFNAHKIARKVENRLDIQDNSFVNAIDLAKEDTAHTSKTLKSRVISQGNELSRAYSPFSVVSFGPALKAMLAVAASAAALTVFYFSAPALFQRVLPRYLDPFGNHPAYTLLKFDVEVNPQKIYSGQSATIVAKVSGPSEPKNANLVQVFDLGNGKSDLVSTPMTRNSDGQFTIKLENLANQLNCFVETEKGDSDRFVVHVLAVPTFENIWIRYDYPDYTGWESQKRKLDSRGIAAIRGTEVTVEIESNIPLQSGSVVTASSSGNEKPTDSHAFKSVDGKPNTVASQFSLDKQSQFEFSLLAENGAASPDSVSGRIAVAPDLPPKIMFVQPDPHVIAVEGWKIPVQIQAADDVALRKMKLYRSINGLGPYSIELQGDYVNEPFGNNHFVFDLGELGASPGDVITYYATISDNYPLELPGSEDHLGQTDTYIIQVISLEDYEDMARQNYRMDDVQAEIEKMKEAMAALQQKRQELLDELEQLQDKLDSGDELTADELQQMEDLKNELEKFAEEANQLAQQLKERAEQTPIYDFEESYQDMLNELAEQLEQQAEDADNIQQSMESDQSSQPMNKEQLQKAIDQFKENDQPFDAESQQQQANMANDLNQLAGAEEMLEQVMRMQGIVEQQRQIADSLKEFENQTTLDDEQKRRLRQLAKQQDLLHQELKDAIDQMENAAEKNQEKFPKASQSLKDIAQQIRDSGALEDQQQATQSGQESQGAQAHKAAESAAKKLEAMQCDCNGNSLSQEMQQGDAPLSIPKSSMSKSMQQLSQSMKMPGPKSGKQGEGYSGQRGSMSQATMFGPHKPSNSRSESRRGMQNNREDGRGSGQNGFADSMSPEQLTPEARNSQNNGPTNLQGVPSQYIDHARAYLKRLNENSNDENRNKEDGNTKPESSLENQNQN